MNLQRLFLSQILDALVVLRESSIVHCDLKPENILLKSLDSGEIKVISARRSRRARICRPVVPTSPSMNTFAAMVLFPCSDRRAPIAPMGGVVQPWTVAMTGAIG